MSRPRRSSRLTNPVNYAEDDKAEESCQSSDSSSSDEVVKCPVKGKKSKPVISSDEEEEKKVENYYDEFDDEDFHFGERTVPPEVVETLDSAAGPSAVTEGPEVIYSFYPRLQAERLIAVEWFKSKTQNQAVLDIIMAKAGVTTRMTKEIHFASELGYYVLNGNNKGKPKRQSLANYLGNNWKTSCSEAMQRKNANPRNIAMSLLCTSKRKALTPNMDIFYCAVLLYIPKDFDLDPFRNETRSWSDLITDPSIRRQYYFGKWKSEDGQFGMRWSHFTARDKRSSQVKDRLLDEKDPCICLELIVTLCEEMYVAEQTEGFWMAYGDQMNVMTDSDLFIITKPDATIPIAKEATARMLANDHEEDGTSFFKFIDEDETPYPPYFATLDECEAGHFCIKKSSVTERWVSGTREDNNKYKIIRDATIQLCR